MRKLVVWLSSLALLAALVPAAGAQEALPPFEFTTPLFGLNAQDGGGLVVADAGAGVVSIDETAELVAELPGINDAISAEDGDYLAVTGGPSNPDGTCDGCTLYRISGDTIEPVADLGEYERLNNPDQVDEGIGPDNVDSNPYDLERIDGATLVADAGGNTLLRVADDGTISVVAVFSSQLASTSHIADLVDCEDPANAELCALPPAIPAQPVPTSISVGPDGSYYVGELIGFPFTPGLSRIWKIAPDAAGALCPSDQCTQVFEGRSFSSIVDMSFGSDGTLYVVEMSAAGLAGLEIGGDLPADGRVNACNVTAETCVTLATDLFVTTATAVDNGTVWATVGALVPPAAAIIPVGKEFSDDNGSVHEADIALLAAAGITRGCNPPDNTEFCPDGSTTRGEMAAFLNRALNLPASSEDHFTDDDGNVFEGDINAIAEAGITKGCNPPENDEFCPDRVVSRAEMAAFLNRALKLAASSEDHFTDDDGSIFEGDINAIAEAGITKGCNPPANDNFCPEDSTTRAQMASFLVRAFLTKS